MIKIHRRCAKQTNPFFIFLIFIIIIEFFCRRWIFRKFFVELFVDVFFNVIELETANKLPKTFYSLVFRSVLVSIGLRCLLSALKEY